MVSEVQISNPDQPHGYSLLSMFPRTFKQPMNDALNFSNSDVDDLDYIHQHLKSMALKSQDKLFEQAKAILEGGSEIPKTNFSSIAAPKSNTEVIAAKVNQNPQERRPGLGRKRARFSLKPESSQPTTSLEPSFDIDMLQNPEEFFEAYEKFENARKELQRQKGNDMSGLEEVKSSANARRRRPGISGKKVVYKHHQYSVCPEDGIFSSQEASQHGIPNLSNDVSQHDINFTSAESQEKDLVGSISKVENKVNELFDELLSSQIENLDGEKTVSLLQDRLQIKPLDLDNLCLPDFHDVSITDVVLLEEKVPKMRYALSDIRNLLDGLRSETPGKDKQLLGSPIQPVASPTPPKNPFASLSILGKHILNSMPSTDPFSSHNIDSFPATSPSVGILNGQSNQVDKRIELSNSSKLESLSKDQVTTNTAANDPHEVPRGDSTRELLDDNPRELGASVDVRGRDSHEELNVDDQRNGMDGRVKDDNICGPDVETNVQTCLHNEVEVNAEYVLQEGLPSVQLDFNMEESTDMDVQPYGVHIIDGNAKDMQLRGASSEVPVSNAELLEMECMDDNHSLLGQKNPSATEDHAEGRPSESPESGPDHQSQDNERVSRKEKSRAPRQRAQRKDLSHRQNLAGQENPSASEDHAEGRPSEAPECGLDHQNQESEKVSRKGKSRAPRQRSQRKDLSRRQSLAGAGTVWQSGVRRSSRMKHRPLEYWKGERLLYGRVHNSLPTVIGLKYISPTKGEKGQNFKVRSYVSDEYQELVDLAALH